MPGYKIDVQLKSPIKISKQYYDAYLKKKFNIFSFQASSYNSAKPGINEIVTNNVFFIL